MTDSGDPRLARLLGGPSLADLRRRLRRHFELGGAPSGSLRLGNLASQEQEALALLMGRRPRRAASTGVDLAAIDAALARAGLAASLRDALERLDGPIVDRALQRAGRDAGWSAVAAAARHPALVALLRTPIGLGLLKRLGGGEPVPGHRLLEAADAVLRRLPDGGLPRAQLAAEVLGDAHALDTGRPTAALVLAALRGDGRPDQPAAAGRAERIREIWARAGVLVNELARPALFLNLPVAGGGLVMPGEPGYASLRLLLGAPPAWAVAGRAVYLCENPNLLAIAADRLGPGCAPLVCTDGMPAAAQRSLLTQLAAAGARLFYHGDFDWAGIGIANHVMSAFDAEPWRFGAADYESAVSHLRRRGHRLTGGPVLASWDPSLTAAMQRHGLAIAEEGLAVSLLADLASRVDVSGPIRER